MSLFRKQVVNNQYDKTWGQVNLSQPISYRILSLVFITLVAIVVIFLFSAQYHRKERVTGIILPEKGIIDLFSPGRLLIKEKYVQQGTSVSKGQPLFLLSAPVHLHNGESETQLAIDELSKQISLLNKQYKRITQNEKQSLAHLSKTAEAQRLQANILQQELEAIQARANINQTRIDKHKAILQSGLVSENLFNQLKEQQHSLQQESHNTTRLIKNAEQQLQQTLFEIESLPMDTKQELDRIALTISEREQALTKLKASDQVLITAPISGTIATLDVYDNQWLRPQQLMLTILPETASLYAELYVPTRAFGFVAEGQQTKVKLDAFPFQKFGFMAGTVINKSSHTNSPVAGSAPLQDLNYKVKVKLDKQTITAYGQEVRLHSGMKLVADIMIDTRSLMEWLLAPLYSLKD